jgi:hypothetical protein
MPLDLEMVMNLWRFHLVMQRAEDQLLVSFISVALASPPSGVML